MVSIGNITALRENLHAARRAGKSIGLVPTMGSFHEGHLTLMRRAREENDIVVVTLFVNPTQFNDPEDFAKYPRDDARDAVLAEAEGVDFLFVPPVEEMYDPKRDTTVIVHGLSDRLEGKSRPGHFSGVATIVAKLFNIAEADRAYFGQKDWQQLQVIKRMAVDLNVNVQIVSCPTVREADGLAMSSRNVRLTPDERAAAKVLSAALAETKRSAGSGVRDARRLAAELYETIAVEPLAVIDYAVVVDPETMLEIDTIERGAIAAVAVNFGKVRLIDNRYIAAPV